MATAPVFLVGSERSGTTLLRLMLDSHPDISFVEEFEYSVDQIQQGQFPTIDAYAEYLSTHRIFGTSGFEVDTSLSYKDLVRSWLDKRQRTKGASVVGATVHFDFEKIRLIWPNARFIHIVRDPRDVAASVMKMGWAFRPQSAVDHWLEAHASWEALEAQLASTEWTRIKYEDLVASHEVELRRLCGFLGVEYTEEMYSYASETDYDIPNPQRASSWKQTMDAKDSAAIDFKVGSLLGEYGYESSGNEWQEPGVIGEFGAKLQAKVDRLRFAGDKYGYSMYLTNKAARIVGAKQLERSTRIRMNQVELQKLKKSWRSDNSDHTSAR